MKKLIWTIIFCFLLLAGSEVSYAQQDSGSVVTEKADTISIEPFDPKSIEDEPQKETPDNTVFYLVGATFAMGALALMVKKKKSKNNTDC
jgi:hypothetical protein